MISSDDSDGRALLKKWKDSPEEIIVSLSVSAAFGLRLRGTIEEFAEGNLRIVSGKSECWMDLSDALFLNVVTEETITASGFSAEAYPESVTVTVPPFGNFVFSALPPLRSDARPN